MNWGFKLSFTLCRFYTKKQKYACLLNCEDISKIFFLTMKVLQVASFWKDDKSDFSSRNFIFGSALQKYRSRRQFKPRVV